MSESLKVAVRCRPFNQRELDRNAKLVIDMTDATTTIRHPDSEEVKKFTFDYSYWSHDGFDTEENGYMKGQAGTNYADQTTVFNDLGVGLLENAWKGFNCCVFAYGQTGSGKSYSIVGYGENKGVIPMTCADLFKRIEATTTDTMQYRVQVTMLEIYNEKLRDLLNPKTAADQLKIRTNSNGIFAHMCTCVCVYINI
ncbi:P-loop containing nucleoside triphosphate hydrolase protein [Pavlovales sp. CCMP2436]|nr:P-loop containing nucleoside triphosphate hydrolase protein [Pavlovales sp. CCMP2436]